MISSIEILFHWCLKHLVVIQGLVTKERNNLDPAAAPFAKAPGEIAGLREGATLHEVVKRMQLI